MTVVKRSLFWHFTIVIGEVLEVLSHCFLKSDFNFVKIPKVLEISKIKSFLVTLLKIFSQKTSRKKLK